MGYLSFLLFGARECSPDKPRQDLTAPYWENAFSEGVGAVFDAVRGFDPQYHSVPLLDDVIWRHADKRADWIIPFDEESSRGSDLETRRAAFLSRKRRALFEHRQGERLLAPPASAVDRLLLTLLSGDRPTPRIVRLLNRFFDRDEDRDDVLFLWASHRYDARANRYAAAAAAVPVGKLEVVVPALPPELGKAFPDYRPAHAVLRLINSPVEEGLYVDRPFIEALHAAEQGLPSTFRRGEPESRIAAFYDRLARHTWSSREEMLKVRLVDIDTGKNLQLNVDVVRRRYHRY
jgi:hypothetical protein